MKSKLKKFYFSHCKSVEISSFKVEGNRKLSNLKKNVFKEVLESKVSNISFIVCSNWCLGLGKNLSFLILNYKDVNSIIAVEVQIILGWFMYWKPL